MSSLEPIVLAREPDFTLGQMQLRPSRAEVEINGAVERLEPRVMQALVALSQLQGKTVSRAELLALCWGKVVVGKDALNRVISILRGLAGRSHGSFRVETLPRIGYRLTAATSESRTGAAGVRLIAVLPFDSEDAAGLADGVSEAILSRLTRNGGIAVAARHSSFQFRGERKPAAYTALGASHLVDGSVDVRGDVVRVTAYLIDAAQQRTLWSEQFDGPLSSVFAVQDQIATAVADTLDLQRGHRKSSSAIDPVAHDLYTRAVLGLEQPAREPVEQALAYLTEVVSRAPEFALGWAALAEARRRRLLYTPPPQQSPERILSQSAAETALALDPHLGQAHGTLANLLPRFNRWLEVETLFKRGLAETPESPELRYLHAQFLMAVGRTRDGLNALLALQRLNPLSASLAVEIAAALLDCGRDADAIAAVDRAFALWPTIMLVWSERVRLHMVLGNYEIAEALLNDPPPSVGPDDPNVARRKLHLRAKRDRRPEDLAAATQNFLSFSQIGVAPAVVAIHALTTLGKDSQALEVADAIFQLDAPATMRPGVNMMGTYSLAGEPDSTVLFRRDTASMRPTPAFDRILKRVGLEDYWQGTGVIPDFRIDA